MSSATIESTISAAFFLMFWAFCKLWRNPVTMMSPLAASTTCALAAVAPGRSAPAAGDGSGVVVCAEAGAATIMQMVRLVVASKPCVRMRSFIILSLSAGSLLRCHRWHRSGA